MEVPIPDPSAQQLRARDAQGAPLRSRQIGVSLAGVRKSYPPQGRGGARTDALGGVDLDIAAGSFVAVIGPSGCGKSTLLRIVAGLVTPDSGSVRVLGRPPQEAAASKLIGLVPQTPALLPWRTVLHNVQVPFQVNRRAAPAEHDAVLDPLELLDAVGLADASTKYPAQLSGGMQQRVAVARAFVFGAPVLLMDEPFSALDELTREALRGQLLDLWEAHAKTVLFVTHSVGEAVALADRVVVMAPRPGRISADLTIDLSRPRPEGVELTEAYAAGERAVRRALRSAQ